MTNFQSNSNSSNFKKGTDLRQTKEWGEYLEKLGWETIEFRVKNLELRIKLRIKSLGILGSIIKVQRLPIVSEEVLREIEEIAKERRAILIKVEPEAEFSDYPLLYRFGYKTDSWPTMPTKTIVLDLSKEIPQTYSKSARYDLRKAEKENLTVKFLNTTYPRAQSEFYRLFKESAKGKFFVPSFGKDFVHKCRALEPISFITLLSHKSEILPIREDPESGSSRNVAGAFVAVVGDTAHYVHAGTTKEGKVMGAPYKLLYEISKKLKKDGIKYLNLEGVYDKRYPGFTKSWQGFTHFKEQFGGCEVLYPHSFTKYRATALKLIAIFSGF